MERNVAVWGGEERSLMRRVVWRLEGEKYKKYAHSTQVVLDKGPFSQPMFTALHT